MSAGARMSGQKAGRPLRWPLFAGRMLLLIVLLAPAAASAMNSEERLLFANGLYRRGLYEMAVPEYRALMTGETAVQMHDLAAFRLGECLRALGRDDEAAEAYAVVTEQFPSSMFVHRASFRIAEYHWKQGRLKDGVNGFEALLAKKPPPDIEAASLYYLALCLAGLDREEDAEKNLRAMLKKHEQSPYADYARLALVNLLAGRGGQENEMLDQLALIASGPETPALGAEALARSGLIAYERGRMKDAAGFFEQLAEAYPDSEWVARTRLEAAWAFTLDDRFAPARDAAAEGIKGLRGEARAPWLYLSANIERRAGESRAAAAAYAELLERFPSHASAPAASFEACSLAYREGDDARVLELADLPVEPARSLNMLWMKAAALENTGRASDARTVYSEVIERHPDSELAPSAAYRLALFAGQEGDPEAAAKDFEAIARLYPDSPVAPDALMAAAAAYVRLDKPGRAADAWSALLERYPGYSRRDEALIGLARAQIRMDHDRKAAETLQALLDQFTDSPWLADAYYLRGTLYEADELYQEAEFHYLKSLKLDPSDEIRRQIQYRRVAVLQRQGRNADAAGLMNGLLLKGEGDLLPSPLVEWLARWNLENGQDAEAVTAAELLAMTGETAAWKQAGSYIKGVASLRLGRIDAAKEGFTAAAGYGLNTRETADAAYQLGLIALDGKQYDEAVALFTRAGEYASSDDLMDIRAGSYLQLGRAFEGKEEWADAARYYLSVGVLFDNPRLTPESLYRAAGALHAQVKNGERDRVIEELRTNYPDSEWTQRANGRWPVNASVE